MRRSILLNHHKIEACLNLRIHPHVALLVALPLWAFHFPDSSVPDVPDFSTRYFCNSPNLSSCHENEVATIPLLDELKLLSFGSPIPRANYTPPQASKVFRNPGNIVAFILLLSYLPSHAMSAQNQRCEIRCVSCTGWGWAQRQGGKLHIDAADSIKIHTCWHWICSKLQRHQNKQNKTISLPWAWLAGFRNVISSCFRSLTLLN